VVTKKEESWEKEIGEAMARKLEEEPWKMKRVCQ
jgi:hypothetical protein